MGSRRQNTLRKDRSKHFFGRAPRLASCLLVYSDRVNKSQTGVSSYHLKLPNKKYDTCTSLPPSHLPACPATLSVNALQVCLVYHLVWFLMHEQCLPSLPSGLDPAWHLFLNAGVVNYQLHLYAVFISFKPYESDPFCTKVTSLTTCSILHPVFPTSPIAVAAIQALCSSP